MHSVKPVLLCFGSEKSAVGRVIKNFKKVIESNNIWRHSEDVVFVFLCGANKSGGGGVSARREALLRFSKKNLPNTEFFLAESIFDVLKAEGYARNFLDIESDVFEFTDYVLIILESESAFCELGAFSVKKETRGKIIVINDVAHKESKSFINIGPIQAIADSVGDEALLYYKMIPTGRDGGDGIGRIFSRLVRLLDKGKPSRRSRVLNLNPVTFQNKESLRLVHDLVFFAGPITSVELSFLVKLLFGRKSFNNLKMLLAILKAINHISINDELYYTSCCARPYFMYDGIDVFDVIAAFKNTYYRYDKARLGWVA
ncbi:MAG: retron St85 family effector protein [Deltaproteobacteria bacterium]|nr:retron St85 family effector protein [Deltaproteobacteria bacterium]